ncbi:MAG: hypothetical protein IKU13_08880 [Clostridia bacterium]|nr:hypothetical protein [Clostridia bacterium]
MSKIKVSYPFAVIFAIMIVFDGDNRLVTTMCAAAIHEMGHIFALIYKKIPFRKVTIGITGANIIYGNDRLTSYNDDICIALMGSIFNLIAIIIAFVTETMTGVDTSFFIGTNALLGGFNFLPIMPLDGGRAINSLMSMKFGVVEAEHIMRITGICIAVFGAVIGLFLAVRKGNFTLFLVSVAIFLKNMSI